MTIETVAAELVKSTLRLRRFANDATPSPVVTLEMMNHKRLSEKLEELQNERQLKQAA